MDKSAFTLHDFDTHCINIYKIISYVLFDDDNLVYTSDFGITSRELYILNLAVLFHDIGMSRCLFATRDNHSLNSAEYIDGEFSKSRSILRIESTLTPNECRALRAIVIAHSDIKKIGVQDNENGLKAKNLNDVDGRSGTIIHSRFLAGVLRLADELDISSDRIGTGEIEEKIEELLEKNKSDRQNEDAYSVSLRHWKRLHLISSVKRNSDGRTIELVLDDEYIERIIDEGQSIKAVARECVDIYKKIDITLKDAMTFSFCNKFKKIVSVDNVKIVTDISDLEKEIYRILSIASLSTKKESNETKTIIKSDDISPRVLDYSFEREITKAVKERGLLKFGHFILNNDYCARDWIHTRELVETKSILKRMTDVIVNDINASNYTEYTIVGIDLVGTMLASRVAFSLQKPLSYVVPEKDEQNNAKQDKICDIGNNKNVLLIIDAISTYETINKVVEKHELKERLKAIYMIFYRPNDLFNNETEYFKISACINKEFPIELFNKSNCKYKGIKCMAQNRKININSNNQKRESSNITK